MLPGGLQVLHVPWVEEVEDSVAVNDGFTTDLMVSHDSSEFVYRLDLGLRRLDVCAVGYSVHLDLP